MLRYVPCHDSVVHPWVADGDGIQTWRIVEYILNNQLQTANKEQFSSLGDSHGVNNSSI
jgi:hypothetical protein